MIGITEHGAFSADFVQPIRISCAVSFHLKILLKRMILHWIFVHNFSALNYVCISSSHFYYCSSV